MSEAIEAPTGGVEGLLDALRDLFVHERSAVFAYGLLQPRFYRAFAPRRIIVEVSDHLPAEDPEVIAMGDEGFAGETRVEQVQKKGLEVRVEQLLPWSDIAG